MTTIYDVDATKLIKETAKMLKEQNIEVPAFVPFVKTGVMNERPPQDPDWWFIRCAAILRTVAIRGPIGTSKLRTKYGGKKNCGAKPGHAFKGSGAVIRNAMKSLEKKGLLIQKMDGLHKGRIVTPAGIKLMSLAAKNIASEETESKKSVSSDAQVN